MAIGTMNQSGKQNYLVNQYVLDNVADLANLPRDCSPGSTAIVIATGDVYMMDNDHKWALFGGSSGGGGGSTGGSSSPSIWTPYD